MGLVAPLFLFTLLFFVLPIATILFRSVDNPEIAGNFHNTTAAIERWDGVELPDENVYAALVADLRKLDAQSGRVDISKAAKRLNFEIVGFRTLILRTADLAVQVDAPPYREKLIAADARWGDVQYWRVIKRQRPFTEFYFLASADLRRMGDGALHRMPSSEALFLKVYATTFEISLLVTALCLLLAYPTAYLLATLPIRYSNLLLIFVMLPFWTAILVRLSAWTVLLQREGVINKALLWANVISRPLEMMYNRSGVLIAMTHVLLPFMLLPIYSVMKNVRPDYMRAAESLGASPFVAFRRIYLPQTLPGVAAGSLLVFISALGYYITPALIGGSRDQMIATYIAMFIDTTLNWGQAAALAMLLLSMVFLLYLVYVRLADVGAQKLR